MPADTFHSKMFSVLVNKDCEDEHRLGVELGKETRWGQTREKSLPSSFHQRRLGLGPGR